MGNVIMVTLLDSRVKTETRIGIPGSEINRKPAKFLLDMYKQIVLAKVNKAQVES